MTLPYRYQDEMLKALESNHDHKFIFTNGRRTGFKFLTGALEKQTMQQKTRTFVASPFRGDVEANTKYLHKCMKDSLDRGEAPFAPHMIYTQVLDDDDTGEREMGIDCGIAFMGVCDKMAVYIDKGVSEGMQHEIKKAYELGLDVEFRKLPVALYSKGVETSDINCNPEEEVTSLISRINPLGDNYHQGRRKEDEVSKQYMSNVEDNSVIRLNGTTKIATVDKTLKGRVNKWFDNRDEWKLLDVVSLSSDTYLIKEIEDDGTTLKLHFEQSHFGFMLYDLVMCQGCKYRVSSLLNVGWTYKQIVDECKLVIDPVEDTD